MSAEPVAGSRAALARVSAAGALVFVALLVAQNIIRAAEPGFDATSSSVTNYFLEHRAAVLVPLCLFPLGMASLLVFVAGLRALARAGRARFWTDLGMLAVLVIAALFAIVNIAEIAIAVVVRETPSSQSVTALWAVHGAAFGLNLAAIAIALVALSRAARSIDVVPGWIPALALAGGACLFAAAVGTVSIAEGGPMLYVGLVGFMVWALFLVVCGIGLWRRVAAAPVPGLDLAGPHSMNTVIHAAFRRDLRRFDAALDAFPAGSHTRAEELHRAWRHYAEQLHQHHEGEEEIFFPALARVADVTELLADLEGEHAAMLTALGGAEAAMEALYAEPTTERTTAARAALGHFADVLAAHLAHEERDFEPLAERHAGTAQMRQAEREIRERHRRDSGAFFAWLLDGAAPEDVAALRRLVPPPALRAATLLGGRSYRATVAGVWHR